MAETQAVENETLSSDKKLSVLARIQMEPQERLAVLSMTGVLSGGVVGAYLGGRNAGWQYLAEKAHNLPKTTEGWYYYHKWKNYKVIVAGVKKGAYYGLRIGGITALYQKIEATCDEYVFGEPCMWSSLISGFSVSFTCAVLARLSKSSFRRIVLLGSIGGLTMGGLQDALSWYDSGIKPKYLS
ncbi:hypothetical protein BB561_002636 [Smittium simulii]|uniref:Mitochondrial import inner membrane translocase subunit TIM22 n=1 Tax=Smittium simulii TaxID=133385 RepID=A0A2T9YPW2_9FUNG|nr:hypothetical protein BB561_002636 [Smittium simulii]